MDRDTFLTTVYVMTDDYVQATQRAWPATTGPDRQLSVSEVLTLALLSRWRIFDSERDFYGYVRRHWRRAFPGLPARSQFNRWVRASLDGLCGLSQHLAGLAEPLAAAYEALDTMSCATRHVKRRGNGWLAGEANIGASNRLGWYEGLNVITSVTPRGVITGFGCAPASTKEQPYAETFLAARAYPQPGLPEVGRRCTGVYLADNGFCGTARHAQWASAYGAVVITPPQRQLAKYPWPKAVRRAFASLRQIVETVHQKLLHVFRLEHERPHDLHGFRARLAASCALHNLCICLNQALGRQALEFADLVEW
jgi:hypothetical protein